MFDQARAVITGGSSGLGKLLAERLLAAGAQVALVARDLPKLEAARAELLADNPSHAGRVQLVSCDVSDADAVERTFAKLAADHGAPTLLINSAGVAAEGPFERTPVETYRRLMDINFFGVVHCCKAVLPHMQRADAGRIVNISSMAGFFSIYGYSAYCATKHAINGLTGALRAELAHTGISVHLVCPPEFDSPMVDELNRYRSPENRAVTQSIPPMGAHDVADAVMRGLRKGQYEILVGTPSKVVRVADRLFPALGRKAVDRRLAQLRSRRGPG